MYGPQLRLDKFLTGSPIGRLEGVPGHGASREGLDSDGRGGLEHGRPVDREAEGEDEDEASSRGAAGNLGDALDVAEGPELQSRGNRSEIQM